MGVSKTPVVLPTMLSPLGKACARMDLTAVHEILLKTGYRDEEGAENEVSQLIAINKRDNVVVSHPFFFFLQNNRDILLSWGLKLFFFLEFAYVLEMLSLLFVLISFIWH